MGEQSATRVVGEDQAPITTLAVGEEHCVTLLVGEQIEPTAELQAAMAHVEGQDVTRAVGESTVDPRAVTGALGATASSITTEAVGEEDPPVTTQAVGEENPPVTTLAIGEETRPVTRGGGAFGAF